MTMTGDDMRNARETLGVMWGLDRELKMAELARALRLGGRDPGANIRDYERGKTSISGPISVAVEMMLAGATPPDDMAIITKREAIHERMRPYSPEERAHDEQLVADLQAAEMVEEVDGYSRVFRLGHLSGYVSSADGVVYWTVMSRGAEYRIDPSDVEASGRDLMDRAIADTKAELRRVAAEVIASATRRLKTDGDLEL